MSSSVLIFIILLALVNGIQSNTEEVDDPDPPTHFVGGIVSIGAISIQEEPDWKGVELFFDGSSLSLPRPIKSKSHRFKGPINWTLWPESNYTGNGKCLIADPGHEVTGHPDMELTVGSIKRGCWCNESIAVTPKPRSSGSSFSGLQIWSGRNAEGESTYTDGQETRFPYPIRMGSFQLMGKWIPWTLFEKFDLSGEGSRCLQFDREGSRANIVTNLPRKPFIIGSIQQSCVATSSFEFAIVDNNGTEVGGIEEGLESSIEEDVIDRSRIDDLESIPATTGSGTEIDSEDAITPEEEDANKAEADSTTKTGSGMITSMSNIGILIGSSLLQLIICKIKQ